MKVVLILKDFSRRFYLYPFQPILTHINPTFSLTQPPKKVLKLRLFTRKKINYDHPRIFFTHIDYVALVDLFMQKEKVYNQYFS